MNKLLGWSLRDYLTFSDTEINLSSDHGLYVVTGQNMDSLKRDNRNAVGKSRLLSCIPVALFESDPLALTKKNRKDVLKSKTSSNTVLIETHAGKQYSIKQTPSQYFISEINPDGSLIDTKAIKLDVALQKIAQIFPLSSRVFYASCYIQSQRDCGFQRAKPADRLTFITELFNLHVFDDLRKHFSGKLSELAKTEIEHKTLADELMKAEKRLAEIGWTRNKHEELKLAAAENEKLSERLKELYEVAGALRQSEEAARKHAKLSAELRSARKAYESTGIDLPPVRASLKQLRNLIRQSEAYAAYKKDLAAYQAEISELKADLKKLRAPKDLDLADVEAEYDKLREKLSGLKSKLADVKEAQSEYESSLAEYKSFTKRIEKQKQSALSTDLATQFDLGSKPESKWRKIIGDSIALADLTLELQSSLHDHSGSTCALCGSDKVTEKQLKANAKRAASVARDGKVILSYLETLDDSDVQKPQKPKADTSDLEKQIARCRKRVEELRGQGEALEEAAALQKQIDRLAEPDKVKPVKQSVKDLEAAHEALETLLDCESRLADLSVGKGKTTGSLADVEKRIRKLGAKQSEFSESCRRLQLQQMDYRNTKARVNELRETLDKLGPQLQERKILEALKAAYSPSNLKLQAADLIINRLEDSLNRYSSLVFLEPMRFEIRTDKTGISAVAIRNNGERSDICHLSGAETNCFRLLFAMSLLPLLPENMRTNFIILDEPDSACSQAVSSHLIREFLPKLCEIVPHVFWITPNTVQDFHDHTTIKVIKQNGSSRVEIVSPED